ncbi:FAD-dependent oxidoreductase [Rickettsiales endosymbiont of Stachyamoeba lipophora]|uniref:FAD-dependent oxidoreductase n=1 Tax=Rickettsiales endosymbiont of Stachyamoeba lipophora TaxID=2486578 RepID=UPI000F65347D|nr:FAD-dependent oxidoreductase [Rickettsiales endosymbiont of Stachyamoeba lipophora]AZL15230.1 hypothetical protein EF513_01475 [Rickettsiales endosymbiont of Stachyamoeba lipophora]
MTLNLGFGLTFQDLYDLSGLNKIDTLFIGYLNNIHPELANNLVHTRNLYAKNQAISSKEFSNLIITLSPVVEQFLGELFNISNQLAALSQSFTTLEPLFIFKRTFVQKIVSRKLTQINLALENITQAKNYLSNIVNIEDILAFAQVVNSWLSSPEQYSQELASAEIIVAEILKNNPKKFDNIVYFLPKKIDYNHLVTHTLHTNDVDYLYSTEAKKNNRYGFSLQDQGGSKEYVLDQIHYCIYCHNQDKDSCSKGLKDKENHFKINELNIPLAGCPLGQKISEMNYLKNLGFNLSSLAVAMIDNPLIAATGHRICNDCMKACIYQKQNPVDIPQIESSILKDVLNLEYGFEIYSLLSRWNPLNFTRPLPHINTNKNVLVVGMGPAGFNLSYHLLQEGHNVVGIDGLKIEGLDHDLSGIDLDGKLHNFRPIHKISDITEDLDTRIPAGFGGVAEYGITSRWDKNNLTIIRLLLERHRNFRLYGGVRFGSNITKSQAFDLSFHHIALCVGAGRPNILTIPNILAKGVRTASDFLMSLQLSGAFNDKLLTNLSLRLPIIVIGGGLTAIDTATESLFYYSKLVNRTVKRFYDLCKIHTEAQIRASLNEEEQSILDEYLTHYKLFKKKPTKEINRIIREDLGGVTILYRQELKDAPSYRFNHEEVSLAFEQGIKFAINVIPLKLHTDKFGAVDKISIIQHGKEINLNARTVLLAIGTNPNTTIAHEFENEFYLDQQGYFRTITNDFKEADSKTINAPHKNDIFSEINSDQTSMSFLGDAHPSFAGNVVKAMASSKHAYPFITAQLAKVTSYSDPDFFSKVTSHLLSRVKKINFITSNIVELIVESKSAAENFKPGQFFRLQNYSKNALKTKEQTLLMEGLALSGTIVDKTKGLISLIIFETQGSSKLCKFLQPNERVILMGPTGSPTEIPKNKKVLLIGNGFGNVVLFSLAKALKENGCQVLFFAGYKQASEVYLPGNLNEMSDTMVWCCDQQQIIITREGDYSYNQNIINGLISYSKTPNVHIKLEDIEHIIVIGSSQMMGGVAHEINNRLKPYLQQAHTAIARINSPMQCMMKKVCAQCLQEHIDPNTQEKYYVYSCYKQDQELDKVNFKHLTDRLSQNSLLEKITGLKLKHLLENEIN